VKWRHFRVTSVRWVHVTSFPVTLLPPPASYSLLEIKLSQSSTYRPSTATSWWLQVKWRLVRVISGHVRSRDVIFRHVTATLFELQPCRSSNVPKTRLIGLLQPLVVSSGQMTSLPGHFRSGEITWHHFLSRDCHFLRVKALLELKRSQNSTYRPSTATSSWFPVKWHPVRVTFGHARSRDIISCHVTATSGELQPFRSSYVPKTRLIGLLQPLGVNSGQMTSLPVSWGHVTSFPVT